MKTPTANRMLANQTTEVYCGANPRGDVIVRCVEGQPVPAWALAEHKERLIAAGVIDAAGSTADAGDGADEQPKPTKRKREK